MGLTPNHQFDILRPAKSKLLSLTMKERPELSQKSFIKAERCFNEDLSVLGKMLGIDLDCDSFGEKVLSEKEINWKGMKMENDFNKIGVVVIGRNEGERLKRCLSSVMAQSRQIIYVDSGSTDDSVDYAKSIGIDTHELDTKIPFSAGRARNEGAKKLIKANPNIMYIQFVDGDCELCHKWLDAAGEFLNSTDSFAVVAGRRKERYPEKSIYNLLCDLEWNTPIGETLECGGDFLIKKEAFYEVSGFNPKVIAGEDSELCYRLRQRGWKIMRLDHLMTLHDAAITKFTQWWKRALRSGYAYAQCMCLHVKDQEKFRVRHSFSLWLWVVLLPAFILMIVWPKIMYGLIAILILYAMQIVKVALKMRSSLGSIKLRMIYSYYIMIGKIPGIFGQINYYKDHIFERNNQIIEYK